MNQKKTTALDKLIRHQVFIEGVKENQANEVAAFLAKFYFYIRTRILEEDNELTKKKLIGLISEIKDHWKSLLFEYNQSLSIFWIDLIETESKFIEGFLNKEVKVEPPVYSPERLFTSVMNTPWSIRQGSLAGELIGKLVADWEKNVIKRSVNLIRLGFVEGMTTQEIVRMVIGTKSLNYKDGEFGLIRRQSKALTRTVVHHLAMQTRLRIFKKASAIEKYQWISTLDMRTTIQCRSLDLKIFEFSNGPVPPLHIGCRSAIIPVLSEKAQFLSEGRKRATMFGDESAKISYYEWLKDQTSSFQNDVLGKGRAELFRAPGMTVEKFSRLNIDRNFKPRTLEEIRKLEPEYFK